MTFQKQGMNRQEIETFLKENMNNATDETDEEGNAFKTVYIGSFMSLDPCGRYHNVLSPNGITKRCEQFWDSIENVAENLGGCIVSGEGDPTDILFQFDFKNK